MPAIKRDPTTLVQLKKKRIKLVEDTLKRNPNSIRALLAQIVNLYFDGNIKDAADEFSRFGGKYKSYKQEEEYKKLNYKALLGILNDSDFISYWHLESVARYLGCPTGVLLILSRVSSSRRAGKMDEIFQLAESLRKFASVIEHFSPSSDFSKAEMSDAIMSFKSFLEITENGTLFDYKPIST